MADETKKPNTDEIATPGKDIDVFSGWLKRLLNPDPTLLSESSGAGIKLYDEVARDAHAGAVLQSRALAVTGKEWEVLPADKSLKAKKVAEFVKGALLSCNFDQARQEMLLAVLYGYYPAEVIWTVRDGQVAIERIRGKHPRRFVFDMERRPRLLTPSNMTDGEEVPPRKFVVFTYGSSDNPYGCGLGQSLWWLVWFKKVGIKYWLVLLEKFGMPTAVGKYPPGTDKTQQDALLEALDALQSETGVKIPNTLEIELLEATRQGNVSHQGLCDYMDRAISKRVLGQTLTTEVKGEGSYAASKTHDEVRGDITKADADLLCECLNATLVKWLVDYNFSGVTDYPQLWVRTEEGDDLNVLAERDEKLSRQGVRFTAKYYQNTYNLESDDFLLTEPVQPTVVGKFAESENDPPSPAELIADRLDTEAQPAVDKWIERLAGMAEQASSLDELRGMIQAAYSDLPETELGNALAAAMVAAEAAGRYDAMGGSDSGD
jgi:phage gp29-like protein